MKVEGTPNHNTDLPKQSMSVRLSDVWVVTVTYPKCGTTQTQKMVWQIVHKVKIDKEKKIYLTLTSTKMQSDEKLNLKTMPMTFY